MEKFRVAVITSSDSGFAGQREDKSGPVIVDFVTKAGFEVVHTILLMTNLCLRWKWQESVMKI